MFVRSGGISGPTLVIPLTILLPGGGRHGHSVSTVKNKDHSWAAHQQLPGVLAADLLWVSTAEGRPQGEAVVKEATKQLGHGSLRGKPERPLLGQPSPDP